MADYTGGYTSAVNDQSRRAVADQEVQAMIQALALNEAKQKAVEDQKQKAQQAQLNAVRTFPMMSAPQGGPQPPMPGQPSVPMMPPSGAPPMQPPQAPSMGAQALSAAQAPPQMGWGASPSAKPELGGAPPMMGGGPGGPPGIPPMKAPGGQDAILPAGLTSAADAIKAMERAKVPEEQQYQTLEAMLPMMDQQNKLEVTKFKAKIEADKAGAAASKAAYDRVMKERTLEQGQRRLDQADTREARMDRHTVAQDRRLAELTARGAAGSAGGNQLTDDAIDLAAEKYRRTGVVPALYRDPESKRKVLNRAGEQQREQGKTSSDTVTDQLDLKAVQTAYTAITKDLTAIRPYNNMLEKNANIAKDLAKKAIATNSQIANKPINWLRQNVGDNPDVAEYLAQIRIVTTEAARVLNNPRLVGQLTDSARHEMESIVNGEMPLNATVRVLDRLEADGKNRVKAMEDEASELKQRMSGKGATPKAGAATAIPEGWSVKVK